ncbi:MAG: sugar MFS transporter [Opitutales bacterium]
MRPDSVHARDLTPGQTRASLAIIAGLFFIFGFVSWANAILIPYFKIGCELSHFEAYLVTFAFYISYLLFSWPAAGLLRRTGFKRGMMIGFWVMSAGALLFIPAALARAYPVFLGGLFTLGAGLAILQTAANPYVTVLGPQASAARRISLMGIANKGAGILAPVLFAAVVLRVTDTSLFAALPTMEPAAKAAALDELIRRVVTPYAWVAGVLVVLGLLVRRSPLPEIDTDHESPAVAEANAGRTSVFQFPQLVLGALGIFLHVGTQTIAVDTIIGYAETMGIPLAAAKILPGCVLASMILGYVLGLALIPRSVTQVTALRACTILGVVGTLGVLFAPGRLSLLGLTADTSLWCLTVLGLSNSLTWAGIWPLALDGLGRFTKTGASLMIMGLCGNALIPLGYGWLADRHGAQGGYWILLPCYLYLTYYAVSGHKKREW